MNRTLSLLALSACLLAGCFLVPDFHAGDRAVPEETSMPEMLFSDSEFKSGFVLSATSVFAKPLHLGTILSLNPESQPQWRAAQWACRYPLSPGMKPEREGDKWILSTPGLDFILQRGEEPMLTLAVRGRTELGARPRQWGEAWPHLLIEQTFDSPVRLEQWDRLEFNLQFRVTQCEAAPDVPQDPGLHTAQVSAIWTVHNINPGSPDYQDMIWFNLPVCDGRYEIPPPHYALDTGKDDASGKFICVMPGREFYDRDVKDGRWHRLHVNVIPYLEQALQISRERGFLTESRLEDLAMTTFNLGWEVTGAWNAGIDFKDLSLRGWKE
jgi:hypothetical protein